MSAQQKQITQMNIVRNSCKKEERGHFDQHTLRKKAV